VIDKGFIVYVLIFIITQTFNSFSRASHKARRDYLGAHMYGRNA